MRINNISPEETLGIRQRVLWPNMSIEHCIVDGDEEANHFGLFLDDELVGVASTYEDKGSFRLRKFAIETKHQRKGLGSELFKHALEHASSKGAHKFWCDARENAAGFYQNFGLSIEGDRFYKSELPYRRMSIKFNRC